MGDTPHLPISSKEAPAGPAGPPPSPPQSRRTTPATFAPSPARHPRPPLPPSPPRPQPRTAGPSGPRLLAARPGLRPPLPRHPRRRRRPRRTPPHPARDPSPIREGGRRGRAEAATGPGLAAEHQRAGGFTSEARPRAAGSVPGAGGAPSQSVSAGGGSDGGTSHPPAAGGGKRATQGASERGRGEGASEVTQRCSDSVLALPLVSPTAAAGRRVAARASAVATDAAGNECTAAPRLSGGQTSFCLGHPDRRRTRK